MAQALLAQHGPVLASIGLCGIEMDNNTPATCRLFLASIGLCGIEMGFVSIHYPGLNVASIGLCGIEMRVAPRA